jgi:energy-coupling factor transport system substrate-specific component
LNVRLGDVSRTTFIGANLTIFVVLFFPLIAPSHYLSSQLTLTQTLLPLVLIPFSIFFLASDVLARDPRVLALVAILISLVAAVRPLGAGVAGIEPVWFVVVVAGASLGPQLGFVVGSLGLFTSALVTGAVGGWLPYQMAAAAWLALGAGLVSRLPVHYRRWSLTIYSGIAGFFIGWLLNVWFWLNLTGLDAAISYSSQADVLDRVGALVRYSLTTSIGFDIPRSVTTAILVFLTAPGAIATVTRLRRRFTRPESSETHTTST